MAIRISEAFGPSLENSVPQGDGIEERHLSWGGDPSRPASQRAEFHAEQGRRSYAQWRAKDALRSLRRAIRLQPSSPDYRLALAASHVRFGEIENALAELRRFLQYDDPSTPTANRIRRLLREQDAQRRAADIRAQLGDRLEEIAKLQADAEQQVAAKLTAAIERAQREAQRLRRWLQWNLVKVLDRALSFSPSGLVIVAPGEAISERHLALLDQAVVIYLRDVEAWSEQELERRSRALRTADGRARAFAERQMAELQERSDAFADSAEVILSEGMKRDGLSSRDVQVARRMWLEFRICAGRGHIPMRKPETWAAGADFTYRRVNFMRSSTQALARHYRVSETSVRARHQALVDTLDVMPCDYRYFTGKDNPLDRLVEAAAMLEDLERRFRDPSGV